MITDKPGFRFQQLVRYVTPYRGTLLLVLLFMLCVSAISLLNPWLAGQFANGLSTGRYVGGMTLDIFLLTWVGVLAIQALLRFGNQYLLSRTSEQMLTNLRVRLYEHLQSLPLSYYHARKHGEVLSLLSNDAAAISGFVTGTLLSLLPLIVTLTGAVVLIFSIDPVVGVLACSLVPLFFLITKILGRRIRPLSSAMMDEYGKNFSIMEENLSLLPLIKAFTREAAELLNFKNSSERLLKLMNQYARVQAILSPVIQFLAAAGMLLLLWIGAQKLQAGALTIGDLVSLLLYGMLLTQPVSGLADVYGQVQYARGAAQRLLEVFTNQAEPLDQGDFVFDRVKGEIEFNGVAFSYPGREKTLEQLNLKINAGQTVAITGENGAGKSTLAHLLMRFIEPRQGQITIDGHDIRKATLTSLRSQVGLVQQRVLLMNASVRDNIAFGQIGARLEEIEQAAKAASALDFIQQLPEGFDTLIGDQGVRLSGGQQQRIALARALLKNPAVLIFDEATSMFDPQGEKDFIHESREALSQRTVILITHRPASLALADVVYKLDAGRINTCE